MKNGKSRKAFTLIELMLASGIMVIVIGGVGTFMLAAYRMVSRCYAEAQLSLQMRMMRERVLFHAAQPHNNTVWSGVLSGGTKRGDGQVIESSFKVWMAAKGVDLNTGKPVNQDIQLLARTQSGFACLGNDSDRTGENIYRSWYRPYAGLTYIKADDWIEDRFQLTKHIFYLKFDGEMDGFRRRERIVVPVFGFVQEKNSTSVFHDNL